MSSKSQKIAGENFIHVKDFIRYKWGSDGLESYNNQSKIDFENIYEEKLYPFDDYINVLKTVQEVFNDDSLAYKIGWHRARNLLLTRGKGRVGLEIVDKVASAWPRFNNFGDIKVNKQDENSISVLISNYNSHELYCERTLGFFNGLVYGIENKKCSVKEVKCMRDGAKACEFKIEAAE
ncbi:MAG: 4-vinyl reductase [Thermoplasmata archaeon]|nr:MAG: 4-vinyl reductase [Thermoplasmata archaeon]